MTEEQAKALLKLLADIADALESIQAELVYRNHGEHSHDY